MSLFVELKRRNVIKVAALYGVASWLLLQIADLLFDAFGVPDWSIRLLLAFIILGFPLTLILSWVYEMTPEGIKREEEIDRTQSITSQTGQKINILIIVLLLLAIAAVVVDRLIPEIATTAERTVAGEQVRKTVAETPSVQPVAEDPSDKSVAVLPFANRSSREEDVFFVDGIHDDILTQLARIGSLTVISRTSVEKFKGTTQSMKEIGATLGVRNILEGGVQRAGDRVRINVQLIDVTTDDHLWADTYDRELTTANIFAIQSEISTAIAQALHATLSPEEKEQLQSAQTENMAALEAYFQGRQAMGKRTSAALAEAVEHFKRAIELDSDYALAYVGLANTYYLQTAYSGLPTREQEALSNPLIDKALVINDQLGEVYTALARDSDDPETKEMLYRKGIDLAPGYVEGHHWYGTFLGYTGRSTEAMAQLEEAARLDPLSAIVKYSLGGVFESLGHFNEAREQYQSAIRINPEFAIGYEALASVDWFVDGRLDEAIVSLRKAADLDPGNPQFSGTLALLWAELGDNPEADRWMKRLQAIDTDTFWPRFTAMLMAQDRGDEAGTVANAEAVIEIYPTITNALTILTAIDMREDRADIALERYRTIFPALLDETDPAIDILNNWSATDVALLLQNQGDAEEAKLLLDRNLAFVRTIPRLGISGYSINDARILAVQANSEQALTALRQAVDAGWRVGWRNFLFYDPTLVSLHEEPEYQAIIAELEADMAAQLDNVREMAPIPAGDPSG
jgi:TolB-like protein